MKEQILQDLRNIFSEKYGVAQTEVQPESKINDDLGLDSLDIAELVMGVEAKFNITISDDEAEGIATVEDMIKNIDEKIEYRHK